MHQTIFYWKPDVSYTKLIYAKSVFTCHNKLFMEICPGLNSDEVQTPYDKHHKVSSWVKSHQDTYSSVKYEEI